MIKTIAGNWLLTTRPASCCTYSSRPVSKLKETNQSLLHEHQCYTEHERCLNEWLNGTVRIRIGDYYSCSDEAISPIRIEVTDIRTALIPDKYSSGAKEELGVELAVRLGGGMVYGGARTVYVGVNKYLMPRLEHDESAESIYAFHTTDQWFSFFRISITHINSHDRCADVSIVRLSASAR